MLRQRKNTVTRSDEEKKKQVKQAIQLKEINQKVMEKEGRLKRSGDTKLYRQKKRFENNEKKKKLLASKRLVGSLGFMAYQPL